MKRESDFYMIMSFVFLILGFLTIWIREMYFGISLVSFGLSFLSLSPKISKKLNGGDGRENVSYWIASIFATIGAFVLIINILGKI